MTTQVEFKLSTMEFEVGTEFTFYNNDKRMFIMVNNNKFIHNGIEYIIDIVDSKWKVAIDICKKLGYINVKKSYSKKYKNNVITGFKRK